MSPSVAEVSARLEEAVPLTSAAEWDAVGLQVGDGAATVGSVGVCHEVNAAILEAAAAQSVDFLVAYHPLLFVPTTTFVAGASASGRAHRLAAAGIALHVVHTAFDVADGGCADALAAVLGLQEVAGFGPVDAARPDERFVGRVGALMAPSSLGQLADSVAGDLSNPVRMAGAGASIVTRVAVVPGSGADFIGAAATAGADVLVTGDVSHHRANEALEHQMAIIDAGHTATERPGVAKLYSLVSNMFDVVVDLTHIDPSPWEEA